MENKPNWCYELSQAVITWCSDQKDKLKSLSKCHVIGFFIGVVLIVIAVSVSSEMESYFGERTQKQYHYKHRKNITSEQRKKYLEFGKTFNKIENNHINIYNQIGHKKRCIAATIKENEQQIEQLNEKIVDLQKQLDPITYTETYIKQIKAQIDVIEKKRNKMMDKQNIYDDKVKGLDDLEKNKLYYYSHQLELQWHEILDDMQICNGPQQDNGVCDKIIY